MTSIPTVGLKFRAYADGATEGRSGPCWTVNRDYNVLWSAHRAGAARSARGAPPSTAARWQGGGDELGSPEASAGE
ncbi:MAG: hypothetical protein RAK18_00255 [Conexivisphaerales archaeon]|nr:hypothetical protein [Conexivisphaerales archaeon]